MQLALRTPNLAFGAAWMACRVMDVACSRLLGIVASALPRACFAVDCFLLVQEDTG
jgi:hypothetical protein